MKNLIKTRRSTPLSQDEIEAVILIHLKGRGKPESIVEIEVVGQDRMEKLNLRFMHKNCPTDVLSFPLPEIPGENRQDLELIGTIVLCSDIIKQNAKINGKSERDEFKFVLRHGLDHLLGIHHK